MDCYYTSPTLAVELTKAGITVTGTLQTNRNGVQSSKAVKSQLGQSVPFGRKTVAETFLC